MRHNPAIYVYLRVYALPNINNSDITRFKASPSLVQWSKDMIFVQSSKESIDSSRPQ